MLTQVTSDEYPHLGGNILEGDPATWEPGLWSWLVEVFEPKTMLDVGCGRGRSTEWFKRAGLSALGLDGLPENVVAAMDRMGNSILVDLTKPLPELERVDLVWCCEVVEHVKEEHLDNLLHVLQLGSVIAMTHAGPGQGGWHHVNCKPKKYWIKQLQRVGCRLLPVETESGKALCKREGLSHFYERGLIFVGPQ